MKELSRKCINCGVEFKSQHYSKSSCSLKCSQKFKNDKRNTNKGNRFIIAENQEVFKDIKGFEGLYKISSLGNVWRCNIHVERGGHGMFLSARKIKHVIETNGYPKVTLSKGNVKVKKYIHRLLAEHFIYNPKNKPCINHIDGNKLNFDLSNIEWCTYSENNIHAFEMGLQKKGKEHHLFGKKGELCHNHKNYVK